MEDVMLPVLFNSKAFDTVVRDFFNDELFQSAPMNGVSGDITMLEEDDMLKVMVDLPGVDKDDIHLEIKDKHLQISAERKFELSEKAKVYSRAHRNSKFQRSIQLPYQVEDEKVQAAFKNGVLEVSLPRAEASKPKQIAVH